MGLYGWPAGPHRTGLPSPADEAPRFACPVLAIYGGADAGIPAEVRDAFDRALDAASVEHRTVVYEGAPHSFFDRKATEFADASAAAWREMLNFMGVMTPA
jgi:carboxymethylenebutenolidase